MRCFGVFFSCWAFRDTTHLEQLFAFGETEFSCGDVHVVAPGPEAHGTYCELASRYDQENMRMAYSCRSLPHGPLREAATRLLHTVWHCNDSWPGMS